MTEHLILNDGLSLPEIGFGTYPLRGDEGYRAVRSALDAGYRLIDSAVNYGNEEEVGRAIRDWLKDTGTDRDEIVVQTKIPGRAHEFEAAKRAGRESLATMGLDRIDVVLIHWPNPSVGKYKEAWRGLVELREQGVARSIGVSNFTAEHLAAIIDDSGVTPAINQVELHPYFIQEELRAEHERLGIVTESWSPLGKASAPYEQPPVVEAATRHNVTPAQVILRWHIELGAVPLPKSGRPERQAENLDVFGFELTPDEVEAISALTRADGRLFGGDPNTHEEM
ncbi:aldo/keto reductase [Demequina sp.]|uniref:aldo/keto reductase n=1 Tax=Demequina sp. TaxID=2050685 RepID=UPI003D0BF643